MQQATGVRRIIQFAALLVLSVACLARADHALSEVWSEGDGLHMKYLTNHDDLLSTKGSELSLGSSKAPTKQTADTSGADDSPSNSVAEPTSGNQETSSAGEGNEEGADSSRQSERVPVGPQKQQPQLRSRFNEPPAKFSQQAEESSQSNESNGESGDDQEDADETPTQKQQGGSKYPESESASFGAALEQADGENGETANVDHGADEQQQPQESPKFRPPGRLFKEAVKMGPSQVQAQDLGEKQQQEQQENANNEQSEEQNEATSPQSQAEPNQETGGGEEAATAAAAAAEPTGAGEPDFNGPPDEGQAKDSANERAFRPRQNMIDFDRLPGGASSRQRPTGSESQRPRRPQLMGGSQRHQQPEQSFAGFYPEQRHHMASAGSTTQQRLPATTGAASPVARPQGNYFRGLQQKQQQAQSPDNERDNFISPGHFPGSMPHLTQAASESVADKAPEVGKPASSSSSSQPSASDSSQTVVVHQVSASEQKPQIATTSLQSPEAPPQVTPQPETQPESQQIMAPILLSTTTMAPMAATASEAATSNATSSSTAAPSLKRFKFRKYR